MANQISVLKQTELCGQQFMVYGSAQEPLFVASDVAVMLNHPNVSELVKLVDDDEKLTSTILRSGQNREVWMLTENGLYEILMQSRKPIAKQFKKGVKAVLKEIRTNGGYIATTQEDTPELIMARALQVAQTTIDKHQQMLEQANERIVLQSEQLKQQAPKVKSYDEYISSDGTFSATQIAKEYGWGAKTLNNKLREMGVQYKQHGQWLLFAKYSGKGYTKSVPHAFTHADGRVDVRMSTVWTAKGREYIHSLLKVGQPGMLNFKDGGNK